jgi:methionine salvage enolase-phosphatase E1
VGSFAESKGELEMHIDIIVDKLEKPVDIHIYQDGEKFTQILHFRTSGELDMSTDFDSKFSYVIQVLRPGKKSEFYDIPKNYVNEYNNDFYLLHIRKEN